MTKQIINDFQFPGNECRGILFWAWNDKIEKDELIRQIHIMKEMGMGGFFIHARTGLKTKYLEAEWFDCVNIAVNEAGKLGMNAWLYDEDRWPSGYAGGKATVEERFRSHCLTADQGGRLNCETAIAECGILFKEGKVIALRHLRDRSECSPDEEYVAFHMQSGLEKPWFNNRGYLDTLNPEAVQNFIQITHEAYRKSCGEKFGTVIPGIFTDEPCFGHSYIENSIHWTPALPERFRERFGYDILDYLPELFYEFEEERPMRARHDYKQILTELFTNAYSKQIGEWCEKHGIASTGHFVCEDTLPLQTSYIGAAMPGYESMQIPGIDLLGERSMLLEAAKQCSSVAHQTGKKFRLTESYGGTGWDFSFAGHKALCDWQYSLGINMRCLHLGLHTMSGENKRDYPASILDQSSWYKQYRAVEDYFARLGSVLNQGEEVRELMVVHPVESVWSLSSKKTLEDSCEKVDSPISSLDGKFRTLGIKLLSEHLDFDYGDEGMIAKLAKIKKNQFFIGKAGYKAVLLPEMVHIRSSTLEILQSFVNKGGHVFYVGNVPQSAEKSSIKEIYKLFRSTSIETMVGDLSPHVRRVSIKNGATEATSVLYMHREDVSFTSLFLCNTSIEPHLKNLSNAPLVRDRKIQYKSLIVRIKTKNQGNLIELDPQSGKTAAIPSQYKNGEYIFKTSLSELESRLFLIAGDIDITPSHCEEVASTTILEPLPSEGWHAEPSEDNTILLDHPTVSIEGKRLGVCYVLKADKIIRDELGAKPRSGAMVQPWCEKKPTNEKSTGVILEYRFECKKLPSSDCYLGLETPSIYEIIFNGSRLDIVDAGYWMDSSIRKRLIPAGLIRKGKNVCNLSCRYHASIPGLEAVYLLGSFGVKDGTMIEIPNSLKCSDWCEQGFENFSGNMTYSIKIKPLPKKARRVFLQIPSWRGISLGIRINRSEEKLLPWAPYETDITNLLNEETLNTIFITVYGSRRNVCGPFYCGEKWPQMTGFQEFQMYKNGPIRDLVPCGLLKAPILKISYQLKKTLNGQK